MDLAEQMNATVGRDRTDQVLHGIVGQLPADQAKELLGGDMPPPRPLGVKVADLSDDHDQPLFRAAVNQYAKADTGTMSDAAPDALTPPEEQPHETKPVQTAMAPAVAAGAVALGGLTAGILGEKLPEAMEKTRKWWENQTTTVDPEAGKPQVLTGPDPSKPQAFPTILPNIPPQQIPPLPPSTAQTPDLPKLEGRPAEPPRKPDVYDYTKLPKPLDHSAGDKPHADTQKGVDAIQDARVRQTVGGFLQGGGKTTNADEYGTQIVTRGGFKAVEADMRKLIEQAGGDPSKIRVETMHDGKTPRLSYDDGCLKIDGRAGSREGRPTLSVLVPGAAPKGRNYEIKGVTNSCCFKLSRMERGR